MRSTFTFILIHGLSVVAFCQSKALVFQSDFGMKDGAVAAMKGVAYSVSSELSIFDLTHEIPAYNIWEAAYRLNQTASYWPAGTVFVSVVDPGVGSDRRSVVMRSKTGHYFVTPDNGTLTLVAESMGIEEVRIIDETRNRLRHSNESYTFHGRDVYAYTGAKLAAGTIGFQQVGDSVVADIVRIPYQKPTTINGMVTGTIDILDTQYGNVWTNIGKEELGKQGIKPGDEISIVILNKGKVAYQGKLLFGNTFSDVPVGKPVAYLNSLLQFSLALNQGNFAAVYKIGTGPDWTVQLKRR